MDIYPPVKSISYETLRSDIRSGDILLCSGESFFSNLIKQATQSVWSHVAFVLRLDVIDRIMILESVESIGVRTVPLSSYVRDYNGSGKPYPGKLLIARHLDLKPEKISHLSKFAVDLLGHPYNKQEIIHIAQRIGANSLGIVTKGANKCSGKEFICSEYVHMCFQSIGVTVDFNPLGFITPADFARCHRVRALNFIQTDKKVGLPQQSTITNLSLSTTE